MILPTALSEHTFSFSGQTSATDQPCSAWGTYQTANTEIHHSATCMCLSASREIMLEKKGRHCEGKEEKTGKVTEREALYHISAENYKGLHRITTYFTILLAGINFFFFNVAILSKLRAVNLL